MTDYQEKIKKEIEMEKMNEFISLSENPLEYTKFFTKCNNIMSEFKAFFDFVYNK